MPHKWEEDMEKVHAALQEAGVGLTKREIAVSAMRPISAISTAVTRLQAADKIHSVYQDSTRVFGNQTKLYVYGPEQTH